MGPHYPARVESKLMAYLANHSSPEQGKFRRIHSIIWALLRSLDADFDYTSDRIERLERQVGRLEEQLRQVRQTERSIAVTSRGRLSRKASTGGSHPILVLRVHALCCRERLGRLRIVFS